MELVTEKYKQTEVGLIPEDWEVRKIRNVCTLVNGRGFKPHEWRDKGLPIIRIQNLNGSEEFNYFEGNYDKKIEVENGQLLFAWSGSRGTSFGPHVWNGPKAVLNYHTWKVVIDEKEIDRSFFNHSLKNLTKYIEDNAHGASALVHTQKWEMEGFEFPAPALMEEQEAIAAVLTDADDIIYTLQKLIEKKQNIKQGAIHKLLQPKENWTKLTLGDIFKITAGGDLDIKKFSIIQDDVYKYPIYSNALTDRGLYGFSSEYRQLENSITVTARGQVGKAFARYEKYSAIGRVLMLKPVHEVDILFVTEYLNNFIVFNGESTGVPQLTAPQISAYEIRMPILSEQKLIGGILSDLEEEINALKYKLTKYQNIKASMMQNLLTGKIRLI
jgi:type I restriction enzyme S subunit